MAPAEVCPVELSLSLEMQGGNKGIMKSLYILSLILGLVCVQVSAKELDQQDLDNIIQDASQGDPAAQIKLGQRYYQTKEHEKSLEWLYKAAVQGDVEGQLWLGHAYYLGPDKHKNIEEATKWYKEAAKQGSAEARTYVKAISKRRSGSAQAIDALVFLMLIFPVWWLAIGYFLNCTPKLIGIILIVIIAGGGIGLMIAFACNGGAGGSSQISAAAWGCLSSYLVIYHIVLLSLVFSKISVIKRQKS